MIYLKIFAGQFKLVKHKKKNRSYSINFKSNHIGSIYWDVRILKIPLLTKFFTFAKYPCLLSTQHPLTKQSAPPALSYPTALLVQLYILVRMKYL